MVNPNYVNEQKRHWRYWVWKRMKAHCQVMPHQATVLFLSGPSPEDLAAAQKYGFKVRNIVAVDRDEDCVRSARKNGCVAIKGELKDVVRKWDDGPIHGLIADYCCGLSHQSYLDSWVMSVSIYGPTCLNFQRGRESDEMSRTVRDHISTICPTKHRGEQFMALCAFHAYWLRQTKDKDDEYRALRWAWTPNSLDRQELEEDADFRQLRLDVVAWMFQNTDVHELEEIKKHLYPEYETYSYSGSKVYMDSVIAKMSRGQPQQLRCKDLLREAMKIYRKRQIEKKGRLSSRIQREVTLERQMAAMKAIRTMRRAVRGV